MCKVMMMAGINDNNRENAWKFIKEMAKEMSPGNTDGCGYSAVATDGSLFGERWHINSEAFINRELAPPLSELEGDLLKVYKGAIVRPVAPVKYSKFGSLQVDSIAAITLHTRFATSGRDFINTHPFVVGNTSLIHNGVISNASQLEMKQSTCDSEAILNLYVKNQVFNKPKAIQDVADKLHGYYACGVLSKSKSAGVVLDIFKCDSANLTSAYVKELGMVFSTNVNDIKSVCTRLGFTVLHTFLFTNDTFLRLDALDGSVIDRVRFTSTSPIDVSSYRKENKKYRNRSLPKEPITAKSPVMRSWTEEQTTDQEWLYQGEWDNWRKK